MTTPTISGVSGTITTGQLLTISGTSMVDHNTANWDSSFTESTSGFEGANPAADGWEVPGGYSYDSSVKLMGSKSLTITSSGSGQINNGVSYKLDASQINQQRFQRLYCRMDNTVGNGSYPNNYHKLTLNYPNSSGAADLNLNWTCVGGGTAYPGLTLTTSVGNSASGTFTDGVFKDRKWYCIEQEVGNPHRVWVNNVLLFTGSFGSNGTQARVWDFNFNYNMEAPAGYASKQNFDGIVLSSARIRPACVVEIGNSSNYVTAQKVYQYPETLSNTSSIVNCNLAGLGAGPYFLWVTNNRGELSSAWALGGEPDTTPPTLSSADDGTPTSVGTDGASVSTNEDNGTLYWAAVTNGGSCTGAQLKAGTGGNIVVAGNQSVITAGTQIVTTITGLSSSTAYQIKWLHRDAAGNDSSQASVNLTTAAADVTAPTLSNPNAGTPTATGTAGAHVDTNEGNGILYWVVVTNGGSCTAAQLKAGSGGNIIAGSSGNQAVTSVGTKTILTINNLSPSTLYQIKFLHNDAAGNDSTQTSVNLTTIVSSSTLLFIEGFDNNNFAARNWYDSTSGTIDTGVFAPSGGNSSLKMSWTAGSTSPTVPSRHLFTATDQVYGSFWVKLGTAGITWQGSGLSYHPHFIHLMTDSNGDFDGLSFTHLVVYVETSVFTPRFAIQDAERINSTQPGYPQTISPGLLGSATAHAIAGGNGGQLQTTPDPSVVDWYFVGPGAGDYQNATFWDAASPAFVNNTWHHVEFFVKMNTISGGLPQADGILKYWVDGVLVINHTNVYLRTAQYATQKFNQFILAPYIGDGSPIAQDMWIDNLEVWDGLVASAVPNTTEIIRPASMRSRL